MSSSSIELRFADQDELAAEYDAHLRHGRAQLPPSEEAEAGASYTVELVHPVTGARLSVNAVVAAAPGAEQAEPTIQLLPFDRELAERLRDFVADEPVAEGSQVKTPAQRGIGSRARARGVAARAGNAYERIRGLSLAEQVRLAREGNLDERVALERLYGKNVWETLLRNPRITLPEVARIARKGTVPRPILERIVENNAWIKTAPVRRALLTNPRLSSDSIQRILRLTDKNELKIIKKTASYPRSVRIAAGRMVPER